MIIFNIPVKGSDHLILWDNKNKRPAGGALLMPPAQFKEWIYKNYPGINWDPILDLVKRKGTSFPNKEKDLDFCLRTYTYIKRGKKGGYLTREEFIEMYGPPPETAPDRGEEPDEIVAGSKKKKGGEE